MAHTKHQLLTRFQELGIDFTQYDHPVVLTVEEALKYVGHVDGAFCKNLFFRDKKKRYYIVSALPETNIDMKVLSQRLGLGKGGLKMAPEEALSEVLQVSLGCCVTPFSLFNESARHVSLLLDRGLRSQKCCLFRPLSDDMSVAITTAGLDKFLKSIGREPVYVDLEANPPVGKDQPPDLAAFVPSDAIVVPETKKPASTQTNLSNQSANTGSAAVTVKSVKNNVEGKNVNKSEKERDKKDKSPKTVVPPRTYANTELFVEEILNKTTALILSQITEETPKKHGDQLGAAVSERIQKSLGPELSSLAMIFKNAAYTEGFHAATDRVRNLLSLN